MGNFKFPDIDMKTFTFAILTTLALGARDEDGKAIESKRDCLCCRRLADADHDLRMLCLPPSDEDQRTINYNCEAEEELDDCITRLEADPNADAAAVNDLKVIRETQEQQVTEHDEEHDHDHDHDAMSGAFNSLSAVTVLATTLALATL